MPTVKRRFSESLLTGMAVFGFLVSLMTVYPRMTITISGPGDDRQPLSSSFLISNDGYLPTYSVSATCMLGEIAIGKPFSGSGTLVPMSGPAMPPLLTLYPGAKESVPFSNCFIVSPSNLLTGAYLGLRVTYRPLLWPKTRTITQAFVARGIGANHFVWYSYPSK